MKTKNILRTSSLYVILATILFVSCKSYKNCGSADYKGSQNYSGKRLKKALAARDSLCILSEAQQAYIVKMKAEYGTLQESYAQLQKSAGNQLNKLSSDLSNKQQTIDEKEKRLRELEYILSRQDSVLNALNNSVKNALLGFSPDELSVYMKNGKVYVSMTDKLLFKSGDANVEPKGKEALKKLADVLNKNNDVSIAIEGNTDNVPIKTSTYKDNWDLSTARANNVVRLLVNDYGVNALKLSAVGRGEYYPVADNASVEGKAKNRRTDVVLSPKLEELMKLISYGR